MKFYARIMTRFTLGVILISCRIGDKSHTDIAAMDSAVILEWNYVAYQIAYQHDKFYSFIGIRTLCMTHLAIHDALNAIAPRYETYAFSGNYPQADPIAAASTAAYDVLVNAYPARKDTIELILNKWLDQQKEGAAKKNGITLGHQTAGAIIALREGDGHEKQGDYTPMTKPGDYQYTPGWDNWVLKPDFNFAKPFAMDTVTQFRSPPPPSLNSDSYSQSYQEVKAYGNNESEVRTDDQTSYAHWWAEFGEHSWNRIGRITAKDHNLSAWDANRMFALINMDIYDIYLASLEAKYYYDTWRPYTAIRSKGPEQNPQIVHDPMWEPEMLTPPWPEYPSAHAAVGAGGAEILHGVFGTYDIRFSMRSTSALPEAPVRTYDNLLTAANDCATSRIMNGYHFRFSTDEGKNQGAEIADYILDHKLRPLK